MSQHQDRRHRASRPSWVDQDADTEPEVPSSTRQPTDIPPPLPEDTVEVDAIPPAPPVEQHHTHPAEAAGKRYGWLISAIITSVVLLSSAAGVGYAFANRETKKAEPLLDELKTINVEIQSLKLTLRGVQTDVDWLKRTMAATPSTSTQLNVQAHVRPTP